ncbi:MAG: hypothetical protein J6S44_01020 [Clostridia bacterium]|nr:hypothetical protein [Clostridia bacterium]
MTNNKLNLEQSVKPMKPMHAGGQPPVVSGGGDGYFHYLTEAGIPYSRLHDVGGAYGCNRYVDIPNIFRDFDADENDPASYDFTFTDSLLAQLVKAGVEPYYRLGVTIENAAGIKSYRIDPPSDYEKWARICEHIIRHYTEGWADGFRYKITYWEIWNEPENYGVMWKSTKEEYFRFYHTVATYLKGKFPHLKFGGYAACGFYAEVGGGDPWNPDNPEAGRHLIDYFHAFMKFIKEKGSPIDFFSWHSYAPADKTLAMDAWLHRQLVSYGYGDLETHLNEWDPYHWELGTAHHAAEIAATLIGLQKGHTDAAFIYDMRTANAPFCPLFSPITHKPIHGYYPLVAFNTLYRLGTQVVCESDTEGVYALAASNGKKHAMMLSNLSGKRQPLSFEGVDFMGARFYVIDNERLLSWAPRICAANGACALEPNDVYLVEWEG